MVRPLGRFCGHALDLAATAEAFGAGTDNVLAHHREAPQLAFLLKQRMVELVGKLGMDPREALQRAKEEVLIPRVKVEVRERMERMHAQSTAEMDWPKSPAFWEYHMLSNIAALAFEGTRRSMLVNAELAREAESWALFRSEQGRALLEGLAQVGVGSLDGFAEPSAIQSLHQWLLQLYQQGGLYKETSHDCNTGCRQLQLRLDLQGRGQLSVSAPPGAPLGATRALAALVGVAAVLADAYGLPLGLDSEVMVGVYPPGGPRYTRHLDRHDFEGMNSRMVTVLLYTNPDWPEKGGELRAYPPKVGAPVTLGARQAESLDYSPRAGRLVCFWSRTVFHEVLPGLAGSPPRFAVTLWIHSRAGVKCEAG